MAEILLTNETFVKSVLSISDDIAGKYISPAMREAQEVDLRTIWGDKLLDKVKSLVAGGTISQPANAIYKSLLDLPYTQYYLAYTVGVKVQPKVAFKVGNFGVTKTTDEHLQSATMEELSFTIQQYQNNADVNCRGMQEWMRKNMAGVPELSGTETRQFSNCPIWLGGARGKGQPTKVRR